LDSHEIDTRLEQRRAALARANKLRVARAGLKRRVAAGEVSAADVILGPRWELDGMHIGKLLMSQRGWGRERCRGLLVAAQIKENKTIGSMTVRQRRMLAAALGGSTGEVDRAQGKAG
jgi:hypothetical protein